MSLYKYCSSSSHKAFLNPKRTAFTLFSSKISSFFKSAKNLEKTINEIKTIFYNISKSWEEIKLNIQKIFTKIRTSINEREDELLSEIDNKFNDNFGKQDIIEESIKLPIKIKKSLEKGKLSDNDWNKNNKLSSLINDCINIEKNIKIKKILMVVKILINLKLILFLNINL